MIERRSNRLRVLALMATLGGAAGAQAIDVWLDFSDFAPQIDLAWAASGYSGASALTASDYLYFHHTIKDQLETIYMGHTVTFSETMPGGIHERLWFGATTSSSSTFGLADRIDWRNTHKDDLARIYSANFGLMASATIHPKPLGLERIATALAGTAAHELGHNLGLQHYDCYGQPTINAPGYTGISGQQNDAIMATGSTGISLERRAHMRAFSQVEQLKLEFADGVSSTVGTTISETGASNNTIASAQAVLGTPMPISGMTAVNVAGALSTSSDVDMYKFWAPMGSLLTANTMSSMLETSTADTVVTLYDSSGAVITSNDDIRFSGNTFMTGGSLYGRDSLILNYEATYTGVYYVGVSGFDSGRYDLLLGGLSPVPEPATMAVLGLGTLALLRRRRRSS